MTEPSVAIQPVVNWPHHARSGGRYVVVADIVLADPQVWPYPREEFVVGCVLEGGAAFGVEALDSTSLVLHRFGGTYGPVRFLVRAEREPSAEDPLRLTFLTEGGWPFRTIRLDVLPSDGSGATGGSTTVEIDRRPQPTQPVETVRPAGPDAPSPRSAAPPPSATWSSAATAPAPSTPARAPARRDPLPGDLLSEVQLLHRAAGRPSLRRISAEIRDREDMPDTVSTETLSALLNGTAVPRWSKVECVVRQLASMAVHRPDPELEVRRFLDLWLAADVGGGPAPASPPVPVVSTSSSRGRPEATLETELLLLYRAAGQPSYRRISAEIRARVDMPDTVSHETVSALLSGGVVPRWSKVQSVVQQLATMAVHQPNVATEIQRFHDLWMRAHEARGPDPGRSSGYPTEPPPNLRQEPQRRGAESQIGTAPPGNPGFAGRHDELAFLRARLDREPGQQLIVHGLGGVGKTALTLEYVHREGARYDFVWWIPAEQAVQARASLAALGERLDWPVSQDLGYTVRSVLGRLESADFRWLIVFDNAAGPEEIGPWLPAAGGQVIVTTRDAGWLDRGESLTVDVLPRQDSIALLRSRGDVSFDEADQLAERLGDLPLALEQAAAWRAATGMSVSEYLRLLEQRALAVLDEGRPTDNPVTVATAFGVAHARVRAESPAAAQLLAMLACLSSVPVSRYLLQSAEGVPPPLGRMLAQESALDGAIGVLRGLGLAALVDDGQSVQVHRLVQLVVRGSMPPAELERAYTNARQLLVAANPGQPEDTLTWEMHAQIGPHLRPSRAVEDTGLAVRRVVLDHARYLNALGDYDASRRLSTDALAAWAGPDGVWADDETFACVGNIVNAEIGLGDYTEAADLAERAWQRLNADDGFGPEHPRTARMANSVAMVSRILGQYSRSLELGRYQVDFFERTGQPTNPGLLAARVNVAATLRAMGEFPRALQIDEDLLDIHRRAHGDRHHLTHFAVADLARDLYGLGEYARAVEIQTASLPQLRALLNSRHPQVILAERTIAIGLRKIGRLSEALDRSRDHFHICRGEFGSDHAYTLAAAMTYANAIRVEASVGGSNYAVAFNLSIDAVNRYRRRFGERNPLTLAAVANQATILRAMGERARARRLSEAAYQGLHEYLGYSHPYTLAAAVGLANDLVDAHEQADAVGLLENTLESARSDGRQAHPDLLIAAANLSVIAPDRADLQQSLDALRQAFGSDHPLMLAVRRGERGECDIEPPPL